MRARGWKRVFGKREGRRGWGQWRSCFLLKGQTFLLLSLSRPLSLNPAAHHIDRSVVGRADSSACEDRIDPVCFCCCCCWDFFFRVFQRSRSRGPARGFEVESKGKKKNQCFRPRSQPLKLAAVHLAPIGSVKIRALAILCNQPHSPLLPGSASAPWRPKKQSINIATTAKDAGREHRRRRRC